MAYKSKYMQERETERAQSQLQGPTPGAGYQSEYMRSGRHVGVQPVNPIVRRAQTDAQRAVQRAEDDARKEFERLQALASAHLRAETPDRMTDSGSEDRLRSASGLIFGSAEAAPLERHLARQARVNGGWTDAQLRDESYEAALEAAIPERRVTARQRREGALASETEADRERAAAQERLDAYRQAQTALERRSRARDYAVDQGDTVFTEAELADDGYGEKLRTEYQEQIASLTALAQSPDPVTAEMAGEALAVMQNRQKANDDRANAWEKQRSEYQQAQRRALFENAASADPDFYRYANMGGLSDVTGDWATEDEYNIRRRGDDTYQDYNEYRYSMAMRELNELMGRQQDTAVGLAEQDPEAAIARDEDINRRIRELRQIFLTDAERETYNYYLNKYGEQSAGQYLQALERDLNAREQEANRRETARQAQEDRFSGAVADVAASWGQGAAYGYLLYQKLENVLTGQPNQPDINSRWFNAVQAEQANQEGLMEGLDWWGQTLLSAGLSSVQSLSRAYMLGPLSMAVMGSGAGGAAAYNALKDGATLDQAFALGSIAGFAEYITEEISVENLFENVRVGKFDTVQNMLYQLGKTVAIEGSQEMASDYINLAADIGIRGAESDFNKTYEAYLAQGYTEAEARDMTVNEYLVEGPLVSGLGGALSGLMGGGVSQLGGIVSAIERRGPGLNFIDLNRAAASEDVMADLRAQREELLEAYAQDFVAARQINKEYNDVLQAIIEETVAQGAETQEENGTGAYAAGEESTAVNDDPAEHTATEQQVIEEYKDAVDPDLVAFYNEAKQATEAKKNAPSFELHPVSERAASDIRAAIGVDPTGFRTVLDQKQANHIYRDHGEAGKADSTMADDNDVGRIQYVLDNYDNVEPAGTTGAYAEPNGRGGTRQAKTVKFSKKVNGTYFVVEAVPDTQARAVNIVSAYMLAEGKNDAVGRAGKNKTGASQRLTDAQAPQRNGQTATIGNAPVSNPTIAQESNEVKNGGEYGRSETEAAGREAGAGQRDQVSDGERGRGADERAPGADGVLGSGAEAGRAADPGRAARERADLAKTLGLRKVNSRDGLNLPEGTDRAQNTVLPEEHWDAELRDAAARLRRITGKDVTFVLGGIEIVGTDGKTRTVRGVINGNGIIVQADNLRATVSQIADHELFHHYSRTNPGLIQAITAKIAEKFGTRRLDQMIDAYIQRQRGIIDAPTYEDGAALQEYYNRILDEIYADAFAGINAFGARANLYQQEVRETLQERGADFESRENAAATERTNGPGQYSINDEFANDIAAWDEQGRPVGETFILGSTGDVLQGLGAIESDIYMLGDKITEILSKHPEMTLEEIKHIPEILDDPVLVLKSKGTGKNQQNSRMVLFGTVKAQNGKPVMAVLDLRPVENHLVIDDMQKVNSAYTKKNQLNLIRTSEVLHADEKRTIPLLRSTGLTIASRGLLRSGSMGSISYSGTDVNIEGVPFSDVVEEDLRLTLPGIEEEDSSTAALRASAQNDGGGVRSAQGGTETVSRYSMSESLDDDLEAVLDGTFPADTSEVYIGETSAFLTDEIGADALSETMPASKAWSAMVTEEEAQKDPRYNPNDNYHGLGVDGLHAALEASERPVAAFADTSNENGNRSNRIVLVTEEEKNGAPVVVIMEVDTGALLGGRRRKVNKAVTVFDRTQAAADIIDAAREGRLLSLDKERSQALTAGVPGANSLAAIREADFKKNIQDFWAGVNWKKSGAQTYTADSGVETKSAMQQAFEEAQRKRGTYSADDGTAADMSQPEGAWNTARAGVEDERARQITDTEAEIARLSEKEYQKELFDRGGLRALQDNEAEIKKLRERVKRLQAVHAVQDKYAAQQKAKTTRNRKAQRQAAIQKQVRPVIAKRQLVSTLLDTFSVPAGQRQSMGELIGLTADRYLNNGRISQTDFDSLKNALYEAGVMTVEPMQEYSLVREMLREGRIYVDDTVKAEFGDDWNEFRKRAFANGIWLTADAENRGVDAWNAELAQELPGLFDADETDLRAALERIVQMAEEGKAEQVSLPEYAQMLAGQEYVSEDELLNNLERQLDWALRTFAEKARLEMVLEAKSRTELAEERDRRRAQQDRQNERRQLRELREQTLKQLQWLSKNRNKAPAELREAFDKVLSDIDIYAVSAANELNWSNKYGATWRDLAEMYKTARENDPNFLPSKELEKIVARLDNRKIEDMDLGALQDLIKAAQGLRTELYNRNNLVGDRLNRMFSDVYEQSVEEIRATKGSKGGPLNTAANDWQLTPMNRFQRMAGWNPNSTWFSVARGLEEGERAQRRYQVQSAMMLADFLKEHKDWVKTADGQGKDAVWYEIEVPECLELRMGDKPIFGKKTKVYMTPAQKVELYLESKGEDNLRHMLGGRTFVDKEFYSKGERTEAFDRGTTVKLAPETVKQIVSDLTAEEQALADVLERYYNNFSKEEINRVSNALYGYDKAMGSYYAPIYTNSNYVKAEVGTFDITAEGVGNLKARQYSKNPSYNLSAFDAFEKSVDRTGKFVGLAIPVRNMSTLMNWQADGTSMRDVLTHQWGGNESKFVDDLLTELQGGGELKDNGIDRFVNKVLSKYISSVFGFNPSIVLKQAASFPLAAAYLGYGNAPNVARAQRVSDDLINTYTAELAYRLMGYSTPETAMLKNNPGKLQEKGAINFLFGGGAITWMDGKTVKTLWSWAENKVRKEQPDLQVGTEEQIRTGQSEFYKAVAREFEEATSRSQPMYDTMHRSAAMRTSSGLARAFTLFKTVPQQEYNMLRQAMGEAQWYKEHGTDEQRREAGRKLGRAVTGILTGNVLIGLITMLNAMLKGRAKRYKDEDGEYTLESLLGGFAQQFAADTLGVGLFGDTLADVLGAVFMGETYNGMDAPGLTQISDLIENAINVSKTAGKFVTEGLQLANEGGDFGQYLHDNGGEYLGALQTLATDVAKYTKGLPVENVLAYLMGLASQAFPGAQIQYEDAVQTADKNGLKGLKGLALETRMESILQDRLGGATEDAVQELAGLYQAGLTSAVPGTVPDHFTVDGERIDLSITQQQTYKSVWRQAVGDSLGELLSSADYQSADDEMRAKMLKKLWDYADEQAKSVLLEDYEPKTEQADDAIRNGATLADWAAWSVLSYGLKDGEDYELLQDMDISDEAKRGILAGETGTEEITEGGNATQYAKTNEALKNGITMDEYLTLRAAGIDSEAGYAAAAVAKENGVSVEAYAAFKEQVKDYDTNESGSISGSEAEDALESMISYKLTLPGGDQVTLTVQQAAALWQLQNKSWSWKSNPFDKEVGRAVYEAMHAE